MRILARRIRPRTAAEAALGTGVVEAITKITADVITQDDLPTLCFQLLDGSRDTSNRATAELKDSCTKFLIARATQETDRATILRDKPGEDAPRPESKVNTNPFLSQKLDGELAELFKQRFPAAPLPILKLKPKKN